jgi:hypothetical protein
MILTEACDEALVTRSGELGREEWRIGLPLGVAEGERESWCVGVGCGKEGLEEDEQCCKTLCCCAPNVMMLSKWQASKRKGLN